MFEVFLISLFLVGAKAHCRCECDGPSYNSILGQEHHSYASPSLNLHQEPILHLPEITHKLHTLKLQEEPKKYHHFTPILHHPQIQHEEHSLSFHQEPKKDHHHFTPILHLPETKHKEEPSLQVEEKHEEHDHHHHKDKNIHYKFEYGVHDPKTHDVKQQKEVRHGDVVKGHYSLLEEDGNVRTVKYYADWKTGFHAQVLNSKKNIH